MRFEDARVFLLTKLEKELPPELNYHNLKHTLGVLAASEELASSEKITGQELIILKTAALFHDSGFLKVYEGHEEVSCEMAASFLPQFDYSPDNIRQVCQLIMGTKIPQSPMDIKGQILCDADLYYLGTNDYKDNAEDLYLELQKASLVKGRNEWNDKQIKFLEEHTYFTRSANEKLAEGQRQNLISIRSEIETAHSVTGHSSFYWSDLVYIIVGVVMAAFALKGFLVPNNFFDGGMTGISLLIHEIYHLNLAYVIVIVNLPFVIMGWYTINTHFAWKTLLCIILLGVCLHYFPYPVITSDKLLVSIFGGFFLE